MLNKVIEKNAVKCHPYWPMGEDEIHEYGNFRIKNQAERAEDAYVVRDLVLQYLPVRSASVLELSFDRWKERANSIFEWYFSM